MRLSSYLAGSLLLTFAAGACVVDEDAPELDDEVGSSAQPLESGWPVPSGASWVRSTVALSNCTGVIVGKRDVITASHCRPSAGSQVVFYQDSSPSTFMRTASWVAFPAGVNPASGDYTDNNGKFADIAYLRLNGDIPSFARIAKLPLSYPGNNRNGYRVGTGQHRGYNPSRTMQYDTGKTYSSHINDGHFLINEADFNGGDSGGPFYIWDGQGGWGPKVQGVLFGHVWEWAYRGKYTSTRHHLSWINALLSWNWDDYILWRTGNQRNFGDRLQLMYLPDEDRNICRLACLQHPSCEGVNYRRRSGDDMCELLSSIVYTGPYSGYEAAVRFR